MKSRSISSGARDAGGGVPSAGGGALGDGVADVTAADFGGGGDCAPARRRRSFSACATSSGVASPGAGGDADAGPGAATRPAVRDSFGGELAASRGASTGRSVSGSGRGRDLGSIMSRDDLRQA